SLDLLLGIKTDTEIWLLKVAGTIVTRLHSFECIGSGQEIANFVLTRFYGDASKLSTERGSIITAHALKQAKDWASYCGGRSDIIILHRGFHAWEVPEDLILQHEQYLERAEKVLRPVMLALSDINTDDRALDDAIGKMNVELNAIRSNDFL